MLTDKRISSARPKEDPYRLPDGGSLFLEVKPSGLKSWVYRYRLDGKQGMFVIGNYYDSREKPPDHVSANEARRHRDQARVLVKQGLNPAQERRRLKHETITDSAQTFKAVALSWIAENKGRWSYEYHRKATTFLELNAYPVIGSLPLRSLTSAHVLDVLERIKKRGALSVASEVRQMISYVFRFAIPRRLADNDPAEALKGVIRLPTVKHKKPMTEEDIRALLKKLEPQPRPMAIALRLILLLFSRPGNVAWAEWKEFDLEKGEWTIPAEKMKTRKPFSSPLPRQAIALLKDLHGITGGGRWLFPNRNQPDNPIHRTSLNATMRRIGFARLFSPHCARATARTLLTKFGYPGEIIEQQLAHAQDRVSAAYAQYKYFEERRAMLQKYANLIDQWEKGITVVKETAA